MNVRSTRKKRMTETKTREEIAIGSFNASKEFTDIRFESCYFISYDPEHVVFNKCIFNDCEFSTLYLNKNTFNGCSFVRCKFKSSIFTDVSFNACHFIKSSISDDYTMDNVIFDACSFMETTFRDKIQNKINDSIVFDTCKFIRSNFINYCLDGTHFETCFIKASTISKCSLFETLMCDTRIEESLFQELKIQESEWNAVKIKNCVWDRIEFGPFNDFSKVSLCQTAINDCIGDDRSLHSINIVPYVINIKEPDNVKPKRVPPITPISKKTQSPYRYFSEGVI